MICAVHPETPALGPCERCGTFICAACKGTVARLLCGTCQTLLGETPRFPTAWDKRHTPVAFFETAWSLARSPTRFYQRLDPNGDIGSPLAYVLMCAAFVFAITAVRGFGRTDGTLGERLQQMAGVAAIVFVSFFGAFALGACAVHIGCRLWGAHARGFTGTARVMGYAWTPALLAPMFGFEATAAFALVTPVVGAALVCVGLTYACSGRPLRVVAAVFASPLVLFCCFAAFYNFFSRVD